MAQQIYKPVYLLLPVSLKEEADKIREEQKCSFRDIFQAGVYCINRRLVVIQKVVPTVRTEFITEK